MRALHGRGLALGGAAFALLAGAPAWSAEAPQWYCSAHAVAADVGAVDVQIYVHRDGAAVGYATLWSPPGVRRGSLPANGYGALDLSIQVAQAGAAALAKPDAVSVSVQTDKAAFPNAHLSIEVNGARGEAAFDPFGALQLPALPPEPSHWSHTALINADADNAALLSALATAPSLTASLIADDDGHVLASAVFDLRGRAEAIRIAGPAWRDAEQRSRRPLARCDKTG